MDGWMDGNRLGRHVRAAYERARAVIADLSSPIRGQECGSTETISEASGAYGIRSRSNAAGIASYETASALASRSSPEVGMATRHAPSPSDLRTSFPACCCINRCLHHGLGCHVQWHVNCLGLLAVRLALHHFQALLKGQHVLV